MTWNKRTFEILNDRMIRVVAIAELARLHVESQNDEFQNDVFEIADLLDKKYGDNEVSKYLKCLFCKTGIA